MKDLAVVILAAGQSKRLKSKTSKVMHELAGRPVITYPIEIAKIFDAKAVLVVTSPGQPELEKIITNHGASPVFQERPLGTAHAVMQAETALKSFSGYILILCGDVPLIRYETLANFVREAESQKAICSVLTMEINRPNNYGRIMRGEKGQILKIIEAKDATAQQLDIKEVNTGVYCVAKDWLFKTLPAIKAGNRQKEYYLTDIIDLAIKEGNNPLAVKIMDPQELLGINSRADLAEVTAVMRERINNRHMENGVSIIDPHLTYIDYDVTIGQDTVIWPGSFIKGHTQIGQNCILENGVVIKDSSIADNVHIKSYSVLENSSVDAESKIGPFARLRPEAAIGKKVSIGNFVEVKKSRIKDGSKANHLTYIGDALVGERVNVGCGTITCNYDGAKKHQTVIEDDVFIGSDTQFIAPVKVGQGSTIGAGSTITADVPPHTLALARAKQVIIDNWQRKKKE